MHPAIAKFMYQSCECRVAVETAFRMDDKYGSALAYHGLPSPARECMETEITDTELAQSSIRGDRGKRQVRDIVHAHHSIQQFVVAAVALTPASMNGARTLTELKSSTIDRMRTSSATECQLPGDGLKPSIISS